MGKKFASEGTIKKVMDLSMKLFPNSEITSIEVNTMWDELNGPVAGPESELSKWNYTLNDTNNTVNLTQFKDDTVTDVTVFGSYTKGDKTYKTKITSANSMFSDKSNIQSITFNPGIDSSECTSMSIMFNNCSELTTINGLENLDTSNVTSMYSMFYICSKLTEIKGIENLNTSKVTDMRLMFFGCSNLISLDITGWDTFNVTTMDGMFYVCSNLTEIKGIENLDTYNVTHMNNMFKECTNLTLLDLTGWNTFNVINMDSMFYACSNLTEIKASRSKWIISSGCNTTNMFKNCGCSAVTKV